MSKEVEQAKEQLLNFIQTANIQHECEAKRDIEAIQTILAECERLEKENKHKDKVIELMADFIYGNDTIFTLSKTVDTEEKVIQYFKNKAKESEE